MAGFQDGASALRARPLSSPPEPSTRPGLSEWTIAHPWTTLAFWALLSIAGAFAFAHLKLALFPDIAAPVVVVTAQSDELDPNLNESRVTIPLENAIATIPGLYQLHSVTYPRFVAIDAQFDVAKSLAERRDEVAAALAPVHRPKGTTIALNTIDLNETPVVTYAILDAPTARPRRTLPQLARVAQAAIAPALAAIPGVLKADVIGNAKDATPTGYRFNGTPAIAVHVVKHADANTIDIGEAADEIVAHLRTAHPDLQIARTEAQAPYIREAAQATQEALGMAVVLAVLVIWPFLRNVRATLVAAIAIPVSLLGTCVVMYLAHFKLETITMLALALVVGVIVDDAIVAVENIVRHLEAGESPRVAALNANKEIGLTLIAATSTIVAVFLPIGLMTGSLGRFFRAFGVTASAAVLFSLLAARTLSPALAALWLRPEPDARAHGEAVDVNRTGGQSRYRNVITWALNHRATVIAIAVAAFAAGLALIPFIPKGFVPHLDRGEYLVNFSTPLGTEMSEVSDVAKRLEDALRKDPNVTDTFTTIGSGHRQSNAGVIDVRLRKDRTKKTVDAEGDARAALPSIDGVVTTVADVPFVGADTAQPLAAVLVSDDLDALRLAGRRFEHLLQHQPGFFDVSASGLPNGTPFSAIERVNRRLAVQITADLAPGLQIGDASTRVAELAAQTLPKNVSLSFGGTSKDVVTTFSDFGKALAASIVCILVVLFVLFRNWVDPLTIVVSLPLSIVGALFALWITRADFGVISLMAVIFLFGLVNKNAIILVDRIEKLRKLGLSRPDAIGEAGAQRLRPILMTTAATILGMLPIALGFGAGAELRQPMAVAIIGGLITSDFLSLIVVPVAYTLFDDLAHRTAHA